MLMDRMIQRDHVFIYSNDFDSQVHEELKRQKRVVFRSLTDYLRFGNTMNRDIQDIVYYDIFNEKEPEHVEKISKHLLESYDTL